MNAQSQPAPAPGRPLGSVGARGRRRQLLAAYIEALGGKAGISAIQLQDVKRCVDLIELANTARAELAAGKGTIGDVVLIEGAADRARRRLGIKPAAASRIVPLRERLRGGAG
jgi:hypothetical protein